MFDESCPSFTSARQITVWLGLSPLKMFDESCASFTSALNMATLLFADSARSLTRADRSSRFRSAIVMESMRNYL
jgi:hypothetical protein